MDRLIALVLLRLKTDLRAFTRARERALGLVLMLPVLLVFSGATSFVVFFGVRSLDRAQPQALIPLLSLAVTAIGLFWALSPLLAGVAFSESHDLSRLLHFPVPLPTLVVSSLLANLAQPMVLAQLPVILSAALAMAGRPERFPLSLGGVLASFGFILASSQVSGLVLHGLSRNRRLQDLALFAGLGLGFLVSLAPFLLLAGGGRSLGAAARWLRTSPLIDLSPFAWGVRAAVHAGRGEPLPFALYGLASLIAIAAAVGLSTVLIHRIYRGELQLGYARREAAARARMPLPGPLGALLEKDLRIAWREPALKATLFIGLLTPLLFLFAISQTRVSTRSGAPLLILASFVGLSSFGANAFGFERRGISLLMGFPVARWRILLGKNTVALLFRLPAVLTLVVAGAIVGPLAHLPAAAVISFVTVLLVAGVDNYMSILFPSALPGPGKSPYTGPSAGGRGLGAAGLGALMLMGALLLTSPFVFLAWLPLLMEWPMLWAGSLPLAVAGAVSVYAMLVAGAARLLMKREPELLERILEED